LKFGRAESLFTRLTKPRPSTEADRVVARSGVRVLGRDEVYGAYKGVSETVPPGGGGELVAAAALHTLLRAFMLSPPNFLVGQGVARNLGFTKL
jgi:hypothetical protein